MSLYRANAFNFPLSHSVCFVGYSQQKQGGILTNRTCIYNMVKVSTAMNQLFWFIAVEITQEFLNAFALCHYKTLVTFLIVIRIFTDSIFFIF